MFESVFFGQHEEYDFFIYDDKFIAKNKTIFLVNENGYFATNTYYGRNKSDLCKIAVAVALKNKIIDKISADTMLYELN